MTFTDLHGKHDIIWWKNNILEHSMIQELETLIYNHYWRINNQVGELLLIILAPVVQFSITKNLMYINVLELKSILFGPKSSYDHICDSHIKTLSDNSAAVHCINNMGR